MKPREGSCANVMDAAAHALQAQHRNRYVGISIAPMFQGYIDKQSAFEAECSAQQRFSAFAGHPSNASRFKEVPTSAY